MNLFHSNKLIFTLLISISASVHALELQDIVNAAQCDESAAKVVTKAITEGDPPKWLYLIEETRYSGAVLGTKKDIPAYGTKFKRFHWHSTQMMTSVSLLMNRSKVNAFAKLQNMKKLPNSFLNFHYRVEDNGRVFTINDRLDTTGRLEDDVAIGCADGYKDENDFINKTRQSEQMLKNVTEANRALKQHR